VPASRRLPSSSEQKLRDLAGRFPAATAQPHREDSLRLLWAISQSWLLVSPAPVDRVRAIQERECRSGTHIGIRFPRGTIDIVPAVQICDLSDLKPYPRPVEAAFARCLGNTSREQQAGSLV